MTRTLFPRAVLGRLALLAATLALSCGLAGAQPATGDATATTATTTSPKSATPQAATAPAGRVRFGSVWRIRGSLTATRLDTATPRPLQAGDALYVGERIEAASDAQAVLRTEDAGYIAVRPGASFAMEQFVANRSPEDRFALRLLQGGLRLITGWVARLQPKAYSISTRTATVGVRGTDHETYFLSEERALSLAQPPGTYDKVNRGGTALQTSAGSVDIDAGKVGFARLAGPRKTRSLITLTLPVILERIPDFYLPGPFDAELDRLSLLTPEQQPAAPTPTATPTPAVPAPATASTASAAPGAGAPSSSPASSTVHTSPPAKLKNGRCNAQAVASDWLEQLDAALLRRDAPAVLALFAPDATVRAMVKGAQGSTDTLQLSREEFAASSSAALGRLSQFSQRHLSLTASSVQAGRCEQVQLQSEVSEQGIQDGKPYSFRTRERYVLELQGGQWLATQAETRQR